VLNPSEWHQDWPKIAAAADAEDAPLFHCGHHLRPLSARRRPDEGVELRCPEDACQTFVIVRAIQEPPPDPAPKEASSP
jgi:hypothetical protein